MLLHYLQQYVQDLIKEKSSDICDLILNDNGHVYVCGGAAMAEDVSKTLQVIVKVHIHTITYVHTPHRCTK